MIKLTRGTLDLDLCQQELSELQDFLATNLEIEEGAPNGLLAFFCARPSLVLLMGESFGPGIGMIPANYAAELAILHEFRADFVVADEGLEKYLFVEFEDAKEHSIFDIKSDNKGSTTYEWSRRFEHGFSQVVDWQFRIDDYRRSSKILENFGSREIQYQGMLVIGREHFLKRHGTEMRFDWRVRHTVIDSRPLHCITFDKLFNEMKARLKYLQLIKAGRIP